MNDKTANIVIGVVTAVWAANVVAGMASWNGYQPSEAINGVFTLIVSGAFALRARGKSNNNDGGED